VLYRLMGAPAPMHMMFAVPCAWLDVAELTAPDAVAACAHDGGSVAAAIDRAKSGT
jgi:hypothetical protein